MKPGETNQPTGTTKKVEPKKPAIKKQAPKKEHSDNNNSIAIVLGCLVIAFALFFSNGLIHITAVDSSNENPLSVEITAVEYTNNTDGIDSATNTLTTIEYEHHQIHAGNHYYICNYDTLGNAVELDFAINTTDSAAWAHMTFQIQASQAVIFQIFENSDFDEDGSVVNVSNNNRNSAKVNGINVTRDPTVNADGDEIYAAYLGEKREGGNVKRDNEIILKQETKYIFRITNTQTTDTIVTYCGEWYEHTNKN